MDIVGFVADKTGLSRDVAEVAVALILKFAKAKLGDKFDMVAQFRSGVNDLIAKAPEGGMMGTIGKIATSFFGGGDEPSIAALGAQLSEVGVSPEKVPDVAGAVVEYVNEKEEGDDIKSMLTGLLFPTQEDSGE